MEKKIIEIDLRELELGEEVLDVNCTNYGIVYNLCKSKTENELAVDYVYGLEKPTIKKHDGVFLFFSLSTIFSSSSRFDLLFKLKECLRENGKILIWDIKKPKGAFINLEINVLLKDGISKIINIKDYNFFKCVEGNFIKTYMEKYYDIKEYKEGEHIFFISAEKKGEIQLDESTISSIELEVHT